MYLSVISVRSVVKNLDMRNIKLTLSYDGTDFRGWQTQPGHRTVQETLEAAIAAVTGDEQVRCNTSGRTDSGVHAVGQVVNFYTASHHSPETLVRAVNAHLPEDIIVREAADVPQSFDANKDALRKLYRYVIHDGPVPDVFQRRYAYHCKWRLNVDAMRRAATVAWPPRLPQLRDRLAQSPDQHPHDHASDREPHRRLHLDRCRSGRLPVQHGAGDRRHADQRRPRLLARGSRGRNPDRRRPPRSRPDRPAAGAFPDAGDVCLSPTPRNSKSSR